MKQLKKFTWSSNRILIYIFKEFHCNLQNSDQMNIVSKIYLNFSIWNSDAVRKADKKSKYQIRFSKSWWFILSHLALVDFKIKIKQIAHSTVYFNQWNPLELGVYFNNYIFEISGFHWSKCTVECAIFFYFDLEFCSGQVWYHMNSAK